MEEIFLDDQKKKKMRAIREINSFFQQARQNESHFLIATSSKETEL